MNRMMGDTMKLDAKQIWENIVRMGANSTFDVGSSGWYEAARCRVSGYLNALSDSNVIPKDEERKIFSEVWLWYSWNKDQLKQNKKLE